MHVAYIPKLILTCLLQPKTNLIEITLSLCHFVSLIVHWLFVIGGGASVFCYDGGGGGGGGKGLMGDIKPEIFAEQG